MAPFATPFYFSFGLVLGVFVGGTAGVTVRKFGASALSFLSAFLSQYICVFECEHLQPDKPARNAPFRLPCRPDNGPPPPL